MYIHVYMFMGLCVLFVWAVFLSFLLLRKLVCYTHVDVDVCPCTQTGCLGQLCPVYRCVLISGCPEVPLYLGCFPHVHMYTVHCTIN